MFVGDFQTTFYEKKLCAFFHTFGKAKTAAIFNQESPFREPSLPTTVDKQCEASL